MVSASKNANIEKSIANSDLVLLSMTVNSGCADHDILEEGELLASRHTV